MSELTRKLRAAASALRPADEIYITAGDLDLAASKIDQLEAELLKQILRAEKAENEANNWWQACGCPKIEDD